MKALLSFKNKEISEEKLLAKFEDLLLKYPDLLEEAYLFMDHKRVKLSSKYFLD